MNWRKETQEVNLEEEQLTEEELNAVTARRISPEAEVFSRKETDKLLKEFRKACGHR